MIKNDVFSIKEILILYVLTVASFVLGSMYIIGNLGIIGIPITHFISIFLPGFSMLLLLKKDIKKSYYLYIPQNIKYFFIGILLWILAIILSGIYSYFAIKIFPVEDLMDSFNYIFSNTTMFQQIVIIAGIPAIFEELFFRGIIFSSLIKRTNLIIAITISSLLFALMHFSLIKIFPTFLLGAVFSYVVYKTKSIIPAITLHFLNNSLSIIVQNILPEVELETLFIINKGNFIFVILLLAVHFIYKKTSYIKRNNGKFC